MKAATGSYFNYFSEVGYENHGLSGTYDIYILFPESFEVNKDIFSKLELYLENKLYSYSLSEKYMIEQKSLNTSKTDLNLYKPVCEELTKSRKQDIKNLVEETLNVLEYEFVFIQVNLTL